MKRNETPTTTKPEIEEQTHIVIRRQVCVCALVRMGLNGERTAREREKNIPN